MNERKHEVEVQGWDEAKKKKEKKTGSDDCGEQGGVLVVELGYWCNSRGRDGVEGNE